MSDAQRGPPPTTTSHDDGGVKESSTERKKCEIAKPPGAATRNSTRTRRLRGEGGIDLCFFIVDIYASLIMFIIWVFFLFGFFFLLVRVVQPELASKGCYSTKHKRDRHTVRHCCLNVPSQRAVN